MLNVALTGNIAAGKSTVVSYFQEWGATVIDSDEIVRELQRPGTTAFREIVSRFGRTILADGGVIDRAQLRRVVLTDPEALSWLNGLIHPAVAARRAELEAAARNSGDLILVNDIPLLFEVLDPGAFDLVILVDAPEEIRISRLVEARRISEEEARDFMAHQMPAAEKRSRAHITIENDSSLDELRLRARTVWQELRLRAARNSLSGSGPLLAVFAHPDDESFGTGGTLARYRDAGIELHLACLTRGEASKVSARIGEIAGVRARELEAACRILGIEDLLLGEFPDGGLDRADPAGIQWIRAAIERIRPERIITFGPDGVTGHSDHIAAHAWTLEAARLQGLVGRLRYVTYPRSVTAPLTPTLDWRPVNEIAVELDVRPWKADKIAAIEAHSSQEFPFPLEAPETLPLFEREWYAQETPAGPRTFEIYD